MVRVCWIGESGFAKLFDQEGNAFVAIAAVSVAAVRKEAIKALLSCTRSGVSGSIRRHGTLRPLETDGAGAISG